MADEAPRRRQVDGGRGRCRWSSPRGSVGALRRRRSGRRAIRCSGTPGRSCCRSPESTRPLKPHWMPMARAKSRVVCTTRASTSTCGSGRSSVPISAGAVCSRSGRSVMMSVFVRASTWIWPRAESADLTSSGDRSLGLRVAQREGLHAQLAGERLGLGQLALLRLLVGQDRERRDADDRAVDGVTELVARAGSYRAPDPTARRSARCRRVPAPAGR